MIIKMMEIIQCISLIGRNTYYYLKFVLFERLDKKILLFISISFNVSSSLSFVIRYDLVPMIILKLMVN